MIFNDIILIESEMMLDKTISNLENQNFEELFSLIFADLEYTLIDFYENH